MMGMEMNKQQYGEHQLDGQCNSFLPCIGNHWDINRYNIFTQSAAKVAFLLPCSGTSLALLFLAERFALVNQRLPTGLGLALCIGPRAVEKTSWLIIQFCAKAIAEGTTSKYWRGVHLLVKWLVPYIRNVIIPTDFHIFQRGGSTTNQLSLLVLKSHIFNRDSVPITGCFQARPFYGLNLQKSGSTTSELAAKGK